MFHIYGRLSPYLKAITHNLGLSRGACRFFPTCSTYARESLKKHGPLKGAWLSALRLLKCHPWSKGGYDALPER